MNPPTDAPTSSARQEAERSLTAGTVTRIDDPIDPQLTDELLRTVMAALPTPHTDTDEAKDRRQIAAVLALRALDAQEPVEALLATHAVLAHHAALACYCRAGQNSHSSDLATRMFGNATMLSRAMADALRNLERRQDRTRWLAAQREPEWRR